MSGAWIALIVCGAVGWSAGGVAGFVYWWTSEWDMETDDLLVALIAGLALGPLTWIVGRLLHGDRVVVVVKRRGKKA